MGSDRIEDLPGSATWAQVFCSQLCRNPGIRLCLIGGAHSLARTSVALKSALNFLPMVHPSEPVRAPGDRREGTGLLPALLGNSLGKLALAISVVAPGS